MKHISLNITSQLRKLLATERNHIFELGDLFIQAQEACKQQGIAFAEYVENDLGYKPARADDYVRVASDPRLRAKKRQVSLPTGISALCAISGVDSASLDTAIKDKTIHPRMSREDARQFKRSYIRARKEGLNPASASVRKKLEEQQLQEQQRRNSHEGRISTAVTKIERALNDLQQAIEGNHLNGASPTASMAAWRKFLNAEEGAKGRLITGRPYQQDAFDPENLRFTIDKVAGSSEPDQPSHCWNGLRLTLSVKWDKRLSVIKNMKHA